MKREVEVGRFIAKSSDCKYYTIIEYQEYTSVATPQNPNGEIEGFKRLVTSNGYHVNFVDDKTFKVVEANETVRKVG
jgi:hypothetical protein